MKRGQIVGASNLTRPRSHFSGCDEADLIDTFGSQNVEAVPSHGRIGLYTDHLSRRGEIIPAPACHHSRCLGQSLLPDCKHARPCVHTHPHSLNKCSWLRVCLRACLFVYVCACLFVCLGGCSFVCLLVYLFAGLLACVFVCLCVCLSVCLSAYLSVCMSVCMFVDLLVC